jgi:ADP-ribosylglycohydrolase
MRLAPVVIMHYRNLQHMRGIVERQTVLTHNNDLCVHIAETMAMRMAMSFDGGIETAKKLISPVYLDMPDTKIKSTGYVEDTYQAASWAVINTSSFKEALLLAVNLGDDADTIGAVTGQIAGAAYGFSSIPEDWLAVLAWRDRIVASGRSLFWNSSKAKPQTTISHF